MKMKLSLLATLVLGLWAYTIAQAVAQQDAGSWLGDSVRGLGW